jgi:opacity protein-like surface antigen
MKKIIITSLGFVLIFSCSLFAQKERIEYQPNVDKKKLHFAYYLGLNKKGYKITYNREFPLVNDLTSDYITVEESIGFNIGLVVGYNLNENISVRFEPGLSSNTKKITFNEDIVGINVNNERDVPGTYLRLPLLLKLSTNRLDNMRAFVIGGVSYDYNFSSNQNNVDDNVTGSQFRMKTSNFMYEVGIGVDLYLMYFKFSPSIRGVFALNNELKYDDISSSPFTGPVEFFGTRGVFLNFTFQ